MLGLAIFTKPADAVVDSGTIVPYPSETSDLQYEIELVVAIGRQGFDVSREAALDLVFGYGHVAHRIGFLVWGLRGIEWVDFMV